MPIQVAAHPVEGGVGAHLAGLLVDAVVRVGDAVYALENMCSHAYSLLEGGKVKGPYIFCPLHGVRFNLRDGTPSGNLTKKPITVYPTDVAGDDVYAEIPDA